MGLVDYLVPFVSGGLTVAGIKFAGMYCPPQLAAVIGAFPLGMISSGTIGDMGKFKLYLHNYPCMVIVLLVAMASYRYYIFTKKLPREDALKKAIQVWVLAAAVAYQAAMKGGVEPPSASS